MSEIEAILAKVSCNAALETVETDDGVDIHRFSEVACQAIPQVLEAAGYVIVPKEPTEEMIAAGHADAAGMPLGTGPAQWAEAERRFYRGAIQVRPR